VVGINLVALRRNLVGFLSTAMIYYVLRSLPWLRVYISVSDISYFTDQTL